MKVANFFFLAEMKTQRRILLGDNKGGGIGGKKNLLPSTT